MEIKKRNSSIECLKIIAIFLIVLSHSMPTYNIDMAGYMNLSLNTINIQRLICVFIKYGGQIGNAIFVTCSAWFLLSNDSINKKKIASLIIDTWIVSVFFMIIMIVFTQKVGFEYIQYLLPLTFNLNWFVGAYIIFYIIHPILNYIVMRFLSKRGLLITNIILFSIYSVGYTLINWIFFANEIVGFIMIYFLVAYINLYLPNLQNNVKKNFFLGAVCFVLLIFLLLITNYLGYRVSFFSNRLERWNTFMNPLIVVGSILMFMAVEKINFYNKRINIISSLTLLIYIIHENKIIRENFRGKLFKYIFETFTYKYELIWVLLHGIFLFFTSLFLAYMYKKFIQKRIYPFIFRILKKIEVKLNKIIDVILILQ